ncbi:MULTISPECIES: putative bifunctional diguanylate cyclase/phosphodiesterase [Brevibacillus]|jgi:EAL domain-containing protein (putative c-di-GMP-specific phosphodiesterase class I)|uniref:EAL domain-containing protein n=1 Tax=Brevibacillus parabrevis TaxID=54914 RepID=A0A4Y3PHN8_BREPA|nr:MULTISPECIES: EAL domain-containing protein [Brevibacillus]MBU8712865.1 EAL domain-containing protein [Brevibacillus parabrevis]MDH6348377.1 EAL domain-containing protein (putative c-di-GMP-specific phosphodiesterase class I) [Brevibacillus sp. 1238]MDR5000515.1 EAL domain-containing protein [Brevibacillus parabrevis]MED1721997.1 EAL domain-containing protein [Brevibacillus parabrevis]MED2256525.1 EAL domain-containing protein [Brevibacillus parabrevis]
MEFTSLLTSEDLEHKLRLANDLQEAVRLEQLTLHYQPQFETVSGNVRGFEALLRWHHPLFGPISPTEFIPLAEEIGLIYSIGDWVIQTACQKNKQIQEKYMPTSVMSVNISGLQLQDSLFFDRVCGILQKTALSPQSLELELTERDRISLKDRRIDTLKKFANHGIKIVLDDFGTEYSSLEYITTLPLSTIKVDRSFVAHIANHYEGTVLVEWIISLARKLGLTVVAEGIETFEQLHSLQKWKCDFVQGFLISKPLHESELPLFFRKVEWKQENKFLHT